MTATAAPRLAVWKFSSCDGCQLTLLDCEDELLALASRLEIAYFLEATRRTSPGPYDLSIVEGSITTEEDRERIAEIRRISGLLVSIGACATTGGIQALRNFADVRDFTSLVYAHPEYIRTLERSLPPSAVVNVDFELPGCPPDRGQLLEVIGAFLAGRRPQVPSHAVCIECKRRGIACVMVARGTPCLGPVTRAGCGALCPAYDRGCFGCFGPADTAQTEALAPALRAAGMGERDLARVFRTFNAAAPAFQRAAQAHGKPPA